MKETIDWEYLSESIRDEKTVLVLGDSVTYNYANAQQEQNLLKDLQEEFGEDSINFHQKDGLFLLKNLQKSKLARRLKKFYEQDFSNPLLEKIAEMPFHLIISLTPDVSLKKVFEAKNYDFVHSHYKLNQRDELHKPQKAQPLLYNLFGSVEGGKDNIYIDHQDLFGYLQSIYNPNSTLP